DVVFGQILDADVAAHTSRAQNVIRALAADAVDVGQPDLDALGARQIHACDTCHGVSFLSLPLLVLLVRADDPDNASAADHFALVAHALDRCSDLHEVNP